MWYAYNYKSRLAAVRPDVSIRKYMLLFHPENDTRMCIYGRLREI
jgi:hypothetical protein